VPVDDDLSPIAVVFGTRPEVIKLAGIVRRLGPAARTIHTGQHYSPEMAHLLLDELGIGEPAVQLAVGGGSRGRQIGDTVTQLDEHFGDQPPQAVVVQGDTNAVLAAALAANAREIPLLHVEAGLRSRDRAMPEEHNRVLADHLSDVCCAPTETSRANLLAEGIADERVVVTGNPVVDAVDELLPPPAERAAVLAERELEPSRFVLATFHRPENVDEPGPLGRILEALAELPLPVVLPLHPRTADRARAFGMEGILDRLAVCEPVGYRELLSLAAEAAGLVSDSGGLIEEASVVKRPIAVVRRSTERPEVDGTFARLVAPGPEIGRAVRVWLEDLGGLHERLGAIPTPYGDGHASERCVAALRGIAAVS
jgi:UDP-N-acetylglucosamine 2-epimerase (non-hydrolysing)